VLTGLEWEAIFVDDDSTDGTAPFIRSLVPQYPHVRVMQRIGRRGLSSACIEGMLATAAPFIAVMDADLQHDESVLVPMLRMLERSSLDIVVASRYVTGGSVGELAAHRRLLSKLGHSVSNRVYRCTITDPMSGFFVLRRAFFEETARRLS